MIVCIVNGHFTDVIQGKTKIFQQENLLKTGKIRIGIKTCTGRGYVRRFQDILLIIKTNGTDGNICHAGKFSGRIVAR